MTETTHDGAEPGPLEQAQRLLFGEHPERAAELCRLALKDAPDDATAHRLLGIAEPVAEEEQKEEIPFLVGQVVEITEGPFSDFSGTVEEVLSDKGKVRVSVSLFGRPTSVELDYLQLKAH